MSAEDVYKALMESNEDVGLATVYRVLTQFEAAGLVVRHNFDGGHAVFELADGGHHDHMVDLDTNEVIEFTSPEIEALQHKIAEEHGFDLVDHNLVLYIRKKKVTSVADSRCKMIEGDLRVAFVLSIEAKLSGQAFAATTIFFACAKDSLVKSIPPSMRATSSTRSDLFNLDTAVCVASLPRTLCTNRC